MHFVQFFAVKSSMEILWKYYVLSLWLYRYDLPCINSICFLCLPTNTQRFYDNSKLMVKAFSQPKPLLYTWFWVCTRLTASANQWAPSASLIIGDEQLVSIRYKYCKWWQSVTSVREYSHPITSQHAARHGRQVPSLQRLHVQPAPPLLSTSSPGKPLHKLWFIYFCSVYVWNSDV